MRRIVALGAILAKKFVDQPAKPLFLLRVRGDAIYRSVYSGF